MPKSLLLRLSQILSPKHGQKRRRSPGNRRISLVESLESRLALDAGWARAIQGALVWDVDGDEAGNTYLTGAFVSQAQFGDKVVETNTNGSARFVAKSDAFGQFLWAVKFDEAASGEDSGHESRTITVDAASNVYIAGSFAGSAQFGNQVLTSQGGRDAFLAKIDGTTGNFLWSRAHGNALDDYAVDVTTDAAGSAIMSGGLDSANGTCPVAFVSKVAANGTELWRASVTGPDMAGQFASLATDTAGAIYASGTFRGTAEFPTGTLSSAATVMGQVMLSKLNSDGQWIWARQISGDANGFVAESGIGASGELYLGGAFEGTAQFDATELTSAGQRDGFVCRVNSSSGDIEWVQRMGGAGLETLQDLDINPAGQPVVTGWFQDSANFGTQVLATAGTLNAAYIATLSKEGTFVQSFRVVPGTNVRSILKTTIDGAGTVYTTGSVAGIPRAQTPQQELTLSPTTFNLASYFIKLPPAAPTKFFVADDALRDRTYQYGADGELTVDHFSFTTANTAPRGAASTAAGNKIWVVDANKTVYVYSASGSLLGSWAAGGLTSTSQIEGITTNGTDIWLVDAQQDRVFKYAGAASRLSGSQSASSNFKLNSANSNAKDLVTDGAFIWVVNDASTDKIFKYSITGALVGTWTMTTPGASSPTGVTLNPANPSALWVVDNGSDKIYQYDAATGVTTGSRSASKTFPLAVGNTNPQGIADPPVGSAEAADEAHQAVDAHILPHSRMSVDAPPASSRASSVQVNAHSKSPHSPIVGSEFQWTNDWALNAVQCTISHDEQMLDSLADELAMGRQIQRRRLSRVGT